MSASGRAMPPNYEAYPQPEWNSPTSIEAALSSMDQATTEEASWAAYNDLLFAVGNNHAGTFYPVTVVVIPELCGRLSSGSQWTIHSAVNALIELCCSFEPEPSHAYFEGANVTAGIRAAAMEHVALIEQVARDGNAASQHARDLLEGLAEPD